MTTSFTGPPIAHPNRKFIRQYVGQTAQQSDDIVQLLNMIRTGWSTDRAPKPASTISLSMEDGHVICGLIMIESVSNVRNGTSQFILTRWDVRVFTQYVVKLMSEKTFHVEEWENPPDLLHIPHRDTITA